MDGAPADQTNQYRCLRADDPDCRVRCMTYLSEAVEARLRRIPISSRLRMEKRRPSLAHHFCAIWSSRAGFEGIVQTALKHRAFKMHRWTSRGRQVVEINSEQIFRPLALAFDLPRSLYREVCALDFATGNVKNVQLDSDELSIVTV